MERTRESRTMAGSKTAIEILENYPEVNNNREATNVDELMPMIRTCLRRYTDPERSIILDDSYKPRPGRLSRSLIKPSAKRERTDTAEGDGSEVLKKIGIPKSRRSFGLGSKKFIELFLDGRESFNDNPGGNPEGDPLGTTPPSSPRRSALTDEKLIVTPAKAKDISINSDVEYDRVFENIKGQEDFSIEGVSFFNNFDVINEILDDKVMADLMDDAKPKDSSRDVNNEKNVLTDKCAYRKPNNENQEKGREDEGEEVEEAQQRHQQDHEEYFSDRPRPGRADPPNAREYLDVDDSELEEILDTPMEEPLPTATICKLRRITVKLEHPVPPQHEIEQGTIRKGPSPEERLQFKRYSSLKEGRFTPEENKILKTNWKRFCEVHGLDIPQTHFFKCTYQGKTYIERPEERRKFIQFLAHGLPWRTLRAVYVRFKMIYGFTGQTKSRRYTEEDDEKIMRYMESDLPVKKSQVLSRLLGRPYKSIYQRYLQLVKKRETNASRRDVTWTLELMEVFLKNLMDVTISEDIRDLKDAIIPRVVWVKLQDMMNIDFNVLKNFWLMQLHAQLFFPRTIYFNEIKIMLIEYLHGKGVTEVEEVNWTKVSRCFDGLTTQFLRKMCPRVTKSGRASSMGELIERLYEEKIPVLKFFREDSYLPRIRWEHGKLKVIDEFGNGVS